MRNSLFILNVFFTYTLYVYVQIKLRLAKGTWNHMKISSTVWGWKLRARPAWVQMTDWPSELRSFLRRSSREHHPFTKVDEVCTFSTSYCEGQGWSISTTRKRDKCLWWAIIRPRRKQGWDVNRRKFVTPRRAVSEHVNTTFSPKGITTLSHTQSLCLRLKKTTSLSSAFYII